MTDTDTEQPLAKHLLLTLDECKNRYFASQTITGPGSREFLQSLPKFHYRKGKCKIHIAEEDNDPLGFFLSLPTIKKKKPKYKWKYAQSITDVARDVWNDPDARHKWLCYHRVVSRLVPNS